MLGRRCFKLIKVKFSRGFHQQCIWRWIQDILFWKKLDTTLCLRTAVPLLAGMTRWERHMFSICFSPWYSFLAMSTSTARAIATMLLSLIVSPQASKLLCKQEEFLSRSLLCVYAEHLMASLKPYGNMVTHDVICIRIWVELCSRIRDGLV